jgi:hypothetical protein
MSVEALFRLGRKFVVPDILYDRELADFEGPRMKDLGLTVIPVDGTLGSSGIRFALATASAFSFPSLICGKPFARLSTVT